MRNAGEELLRRKDGRRVSVSVDHSGIPTEAMLAAESMASKSTLRNVRRIGGMLRTGMPPAHP